MKKELLYIAFCLSFAIACTTDAYDKGEGKYSMMTAEMVDAHVGSDKYVDYVDTDEGVRLTAKTPFTSSWVTTADTTYRGLLYYNKVEEGKVEAVSFSRVGVMIPKPASEMEKGVKTDPLYYESAWQSRTNKYLNLRLRLLTGATDDEEARHIIGLVCDTVMVNADSTRMACCRLYHDQGGRPEYYSSLVYASIPLAAIDADSLMLTVNVYDKGLFTKTFSLK